MMPVLGVWGTTYARGSDIQNGGIVKPNDGLSFERYNWGVGLQLSIPLLQAVKIRPQLQQQDFFIRSNEEKVNNISLQLRKQLEIADTALNNDYCYRKSESGIV